MAQTSEQDTKTIQSEIKTILQALTGIKSGYDYPLSTLPSLMPAVEVFYTREVNTYNTVNDYKTDYYFKARVYKIFQNKNSWYGLLDERDDIVDDINSHQSLSGYALDMFVEDAEAVGLGEDKICIEFNIRVGMLREYN